MFGCVAVAWSGVQAYVRHIRGTDALGFVFIIVLLIFWCLPMTAVLIQIGTDGVTTREAGPERRMIRRAAEVSLVSGAGFFLAYGLWMGALALVHPILPTFELIFDGALILIFAASSFGCALRLGPGPESQDGSRWLMGVILSVTALIAAHTIAIVWGGFQTGLLPLVLPGAVWLVVLTWSLWRWRRRATAAAGR